MAIKRGKDLDKQVERVILRRCRGPDNVVFAVGDTVKMPLKLANLLRTKTCLPGSDEAKGAIAQGKANAAAAKAAAK